MTIYESDIQDFFFYRLIEAGLAPSTGDLKVISEIAFDFLIEIGVLNPDNITYEDIDEE